MCNSLITCSSYVSILFHLEQHVYIISYYNTNMNYLELFDDVEESIISWLEQNKKDG